MTTYRKRSLALASDRMELLREFIALCESGEAAGYAVYGDFDPATDTRCLSREAIEEIRDAWNYMKFLELKRPESRPPIQMIRAKLLILYGELKKLEEMERREGT